MKSLRDEIKLRLEMSWTDLISSDQQEDFIRVKRGSHSKNTYYFYQHRKGESMICYILRHGKDDNTVRGGWSNAPLTEEGVSEVKALADKISLNPTLNITDIFSSDLLRAKQTAEIISSKLHIEVQFLAMFREVNNGVLAGMKNDIAKEKYPNLFWNTLEWDERYPEGESPKEFFERITIAWNEFKERVRLSHGNVLLVTHGGVINAIYHIENEIPYSNKTKSFSLKPANMISFEI